MYIAICQKKIKYVADKQFPARLQKMNAIHWKSPKQTSANTHIIGLSAKEKMKKMQEPLSNSEANSKENHLRVTELEDRTRDIWEETP